MAGIILWLQLCGAYIYTRWLSFGQPAFPVCKSSVSNSKDIFDVLDGTDVDYDEKIFDAITEVRLARWARANGFNNIEKLETVQNRKTPEFLLKSADKIALAEAKHYRERDYLPSFIAERSEGLAIKVGGLCETGLKISTTNLYSERRIDILLTLEMTFKLFSKMYDNRSYGKESFESSYQLEGSSPVPGLGAVPNGLEAEGHRRGHGGDQGGRSANG
jgi:hypothetical protein